MSSPSIGSMTEIEQSNPTSKQKKWADKVWCQYDVTGEVVKCHYCKDQLESALLNADKHDLHKQKLHCKSFIYM